MNLIALLSTALDASPNLIRVFIYLILCYPFSYIFYELQKQQFFSLNHKYLYLTSVGVSSILFLYGPLAIMEILFICMPIYFMLSFFDNNNNNQKMVHWASNGTFIWLLSNVAFYHYARWRDSIAEQMDLAIVTMLLTVKLTSLVHFQLDNLIEKFKVLPDNKSPKFSTPGQTENNCLASLQKLDAADKARHRYQKLGLFEFISYIFFFPGLTTGPVPTLPEFRAFLMQSIPKHFELEQLKISIKSLVLGIILTLSWNFLKPYINENIYLERYLEIPFYQKLIYLYGVNVVARFKYYGAWLLTEGSLHAIGASYNPYGHCSKTRWNKLKNIDILKVEFSPDFRSLVNAWNMTVAQWLHRDVFSRTLLTYGPQKSNLLTYFVSAFWHGMYPFYYVVFISGSFISITEKKIWKKYSLRYAVFREMPLWFRIGKIVLTQALLQYLTLAFLILEWDRAWIFWKSLYFYGHILVFILFFFF